MDRDELKDGGSIIWYNTIKAVKALNLGYTTLETLIPDFRHKRKIYRDHRRPSQVVSHNIETTERLTRQVRVQAKYWQSMETLKILKAGDAHKSGKMFGLGEAKEEVIQTLRGIYITAGPTVTVGQYLQPTKGTCLLNVSSTRMSSPNTARPVTDR